MVRVMMFLCALRTANLCLTTGAERRHNTNHIKVNADPTKANVNPTKANANPIKMSVSHIKGNASPIRANVNPTNRVSVNHIKGNASHTNIMNANPIGASVNHIKIPMSAQGRTQGPPLQTMLCRLRTSFPSSCMDAMLCARLLKAAEA